MTNETIDFLIKNLFFKLKNTAALILRSEVEEFKRFGVLVNFCFIETQSGSARTWFLLDYKNLILKV